MLYVQAISCWRRVTQAGYYFTWFNLVLSAAAAVTFNCWFFMFFVLRREKKHPVHCGHSEWSAFVMCFSFCSFDARAKTQQWRTGLEVTEPIFFYFYFIFVFLPSLLGVNGLIYIHSSPCVTTQVRAGGDQMFCICKFRLKSVLSTFDLFPFCAHVSPNRK